MTPPRASCYDALPSFSNEARHDELARSDSAVWPSRLEPMQERNSDGHGTHPRLRTLTRRRHSRDWTGSRVFSPGWDLHVPAALLLGAGCHRRHRAFHRLFEGEDQRQRVLDQDPQGIAGQPERQGGDQGLRAEQGPRGVGDEGRPAALRPLPRGHREDHRERRAV